MPSSPAPLRSGFPPAQRRYVGIVLDVAFDHYLICHRPTLLTSIGRRLRRENPLPLAGAIIVHKDAELEAAFLALFPELLAFASSTQN